MGNRITRPENGDKEGRFLEEVVRKINRLLSYFTTTGAFKPPSMADSAAEVNTVYYSTTASKLVYKDSGGTVRNLY